MKENRNIGKLKVHHLNLFVTNTVKHISYFNIIAQALSILVNTLAASE